MVDPEHLGLIKQGVGQWNVTRPERPDLRKANLTEANLDGADLSGLFNQDEPPGLKLCGALLPGHRWPVLAGFEPTAVRPRYDPPATVGLALHPWSMTTHPVT
jgi:hypothetical protein